jgi:histidinol-phosphate phosphatase family protein
VGGDDLTAAVLVGGQGLRLRSVVSDRPKVLASVAGRPFLAYLLDQLGRQGVRRVVLCTGYRGEQIESEFGRSYQGLALEYAPEQEPLGTGGALRNALPRLGSDPVLTLNGDSCCNYLLKPFLAWHRARRAAASLWLTEVADARRFGRVQAAEDGTLRRFEEKAGTDERPSPNGVGGWINAGIYLLAQRFLAAIPAGRAVSLEREVFPAWVGRGLYGYRSAAPFLDIGTPESYARAEAFLGALPKAGGRPRRFVLLDRDGVINVERNYLSDPEQMELIPGAAAGLRRLQELGLGLVVVTNQSGIGRGYYDETRLEAIHARLRELLGAAGVALDGIYFCPHTPDDDCDCRKPAVGLAHRAAAEHGFDPHQAFVVGDKKCDIDFGRRLGATTFLVLTGYGAEARRDVAVAPAYVAAELPDVAALIERLLDVPADS